LDYIIRHFYVIELSTDGGQVSGDQQPRELIPYAELLNLDDERLMRELVAGRDDAFAVIFQRYHRLVHTTALRLLRDAGEAEDLTQAVFFEIYGRAGQFDPARGTLKIWLLQFAYSRSMNRRNYLSVRHFKRQEEIGEAEKAQGIWSPFSLHTPESICLSDELIAILPEAQRRTIEMFFFEGLTLKEIAERTEQTFSNVRHHYYRGLERLREFLATGKPDDHDTTLHVQL
jgi:RNA polymerase sigma-70 factor (ECF subfamily)